MNLLELVELAKQGMKPEYFVSLTRKPGPELSRALTEVLDRFGTMNYQVQEGFLRYVIADGLLSGQCPFRVGTEQFDAWSTAIIDASPHDMLELIGLLMRQRS